MHIAVAVVVAVSFCLGVAIQTKENLNWYYLIKTLSPGRGDSLQQTNNL